MAVGHGPLNDIIDDKNLCDLDQKFSYVRQHTTSLHTHIDRLQGRIDEVKVQLTKMQHHAKVLVEKAGNRHGVFDRARAEVARRTKAITAVLAQMELEMKAQARLLAELEAAQRTLLRRKLFPGNYLAHD